MKHFISKEERKVLRNGVEEIKFLSYDKEFGYDLRYKVSVAKYPDFCLSAKSTVDELCSGDDHHYELSADRKSLIYVRHIEDKGSFIYMPPRYRKERHIGYVWVHGAYTEEEMKEIGIPEPKYILVESSSCYDYYYCYDCKQNVKATFKKGNFASALYVKDGKDYFPPKSLVEEMKNWISKNKPNII